MRQPLPVTPHEIVTWNLDHGNWPRNLSHLSSENKTHENQGHASFQYIGEDWKTFYPGTYLLFKREWIALRLICWRKSLFLNLLKTSWKVQIFKHAQATIIGSVYFNLNPPQFLSPPPLTHTTHTPSCQFLYRFYRFRILRQGLVLLPVKSRLPNQLLR